MFGSFEYFMYITDMKTCSKCKISKEESEFNKKGQGLQPQCRICSNENLKLDYQKNKERYIQKAKRNRTKYIESLDNYKKTLNCFDCGKSFEDCWWICDFHHLGDDKSFNIANKKGYLKIESIKEELDKCIPLCANCHRTLHWKEKMEFEALR